jgi:hypothetical protein
MRKPRLDLTAQMSLIDPSILLSSETAVRININKLMILMVLARFEKSLIYVEMT